MAQETVGVRSPTATDGDRRCRCFCHCGREAKRVEQALAGDRELARRYELVRQELAETARLNETLGAPSARAVEKLFAAINAEEALALTGGAGPSIGRDS
jgi:hypothetical protein